LEENTKVEESWICPPSIPTFRNGILILSYPWQSWFSDFCTEIYSKSLSGFRALNHTTDFPGSPVGRWQILKHLSFHNHMTQYFIINRRQMIDIQTDRQIVSQLSIIVTKYLEEST
jgi:hypothetical protein